jgi:enoyl-CoA hydratase
MWRLRQRVGDQGAAALVICGDVLDGAEAAAAGLAWRCVPAGEAEATAIALAARAAGRSRDLVVRTKQTLRASAGLLDPAAAVALELEAQQWSVEQPGFAEAVERMKQRLSRK